MGRGRGEAHLAHRLLAREDSLPGALPLGAEQGIGAAAKTITIPRNGYLPWAMEFRCGLPITLTLVYMLVGHRLNIPVEGVAARATSWRGSTA